MDGKRPAWCEQRTALVFGAFLVWLFPAPVRSADEPNKDIAVSVNPAMIIDQNLYAEKKTACGPAALANSLRFGNPSLATTWNGFVGGDDTTRLRFVIDRWFLNRPSVVFPAKKRLSFDGVLEEDLAAAYNELLKDFELPPLQAGYLDRQAGEKSPAFLKRVHKNLTESLEAGVPPVLSLKTFVARRLERMDDKIAWELGAHHWLVVTRAPGELRISDLGFAIDLIDPNGGYPTSAYIYAENRLNFRALKGTEENGNWLSGRPFLLVQAPGVLSLRPDEAEWTDRIIVVANYLIGKY